MCLCVYMPTEATVVRCPHALQIWVVRGAQYRWCKLSLISLQEQYVLLAPKPPLQLPTDTILLMADARWQLFIAPYHYLENVDHPGLVAHTTNLSIQEAKSHQATKRTMTCVALHLSTYQSVNTRRLALRRSDLSGLPMKSQHSPVPTSCSAKM